MNKSDNTSRDRLREYIDPENIEKAPDEFTHAVMSRVRREAEADKAAIKRSSGILVPFLAAGITIALVMAAVLFRNSISTPAAIMNFLMNIQSNLPEPDLGRLFSISLPVWIIYLFIGMPLLVIFDRALFGMFHREIK
ncbi:MAG: hypothetical protein ABSG89_01215 [Bacteroidales bacterium]|jgi:hypothetical protein